MARKKWSPQSEITPELELSREKRKWQIALRRYVLESQPCIAYAKYFGLDTKTMRKWFEVQFASEMSWETFGKNWQFEHLIPVVYFDFSKTEDLRLCWNFMNLRVVSTDSSKNASTKADLLICREFFESIFEKTGFPVCKQFLQKIEEIQGAEKLNPEVVIKFITEKSEFLNSIREYSDFEFELLNIGRSIDQIASEIAQMKTIKF